MNRRDTGRPHGSHASPRRLASTLARHKVLTGIGAFIMLSLIVRAVAPHAAGSQASPPLAGPASTAAAARPVSTSALAVARPTTPARPGFPPTTVAGFQALAATGDASEVHEIRVTSEGLPSCPTPTIYVTVGAALTGRTLEADLSAFFQRRGLTASQCQAFVYAFHSRSDYQAHENDGYTAGRVALTNDSSSQRNLEVDTGSVYDLQTQFDFNF